jgi:ABC-type glycerol-3-phosphate transport system permease component
MPMVGRVGRKNPRVWGFLLTCYILLTLGGLSMIIPFAIMLTSAVSNEWDYEKFHVVPTYVVDRQERYMKFVTEKYLDIAEPRTKVSRDFRLFSSAYHPGPTRRSFRMMREDKTFFNELPYKFGSEKGREDQLQRIYDDYKEWIQDYSEPLLTLPMFARFTRVKYQDTMRLFYEDAFLESKGLGRGSLSSDDLEVGALNLMAESWQDAKFQKFFYLEMIAEGSYPYHLRTWMPPLDEQRLQDYIRFVKFLPADWRIPITARHLWLRYLENAVSDFKTFKTTTGLDITSYEDVPFPETAPENPTLLKLWKTFVGEKWPLWMLRLPPEMKGSYLDYLKKRAGKGGLTRLNQLANSDYASWDVVPYTGAPPISPLERNFWRDFLGQLPVKQLATYRIYPEQSYRAFLEERYGSVEKLNDAYGWDATSFNVVDIPIADVDYAQFLDQEGDFVWTFLTFNFRQVFIYMAVQGRALFNTVVLVGLSILACLTINPLAAYGLSRFRLQWTPKILLFLLATMAFPAEVSMIPNFLLLRELGLLNTFGALILPTLANGFGIFLLKGFFDSLPPELYEAATIDGASEWTMFTKITLPLCKPILAYQALLTFVAAYGGFMWAFLVCQDKRMWTLMVWIYQYQQAANAFPYMVMASFVLASLPTLLVFLFCQKIILRGIIIPTMK